MKIRLAELRKLVRSVIKEAQDTPTMSSQLDPKEKELAAAFPKWGNPQAKMKQDSPAEVKVKQISKILAAKGLANDAANKKKITHELLPFVEKMDPSEVMMADAEELASAFAQKVLGKGAD